MCQSFLLKLSQMLCSFFPLMWPVNYLRWKCFVSQSKLHWKITVMLQTIITTNHFHLNLLVLFAVCVKLHPTYSYKIWIIIMNNSSPSLAQPQVIRSHSSSLQHFCSHLLPSFVASFFLNWFRKCLPVLIQQTKNGKVKLISIYGISAAENSGCLGWLTLISLALFFLFLFSFLIFEYQRLWKQIWSQRCLSWILFDPDMTSLSGLNDDNVKFNSVSKNENKNNTSYANESISFPIMNKQT